jgi:glyoxylase-like metal-dependent hydrolase (beta-lactamase superfamily II)
MRLLDRVLLVGSGDLGVNLTDPYDCHVYLVDGGEELALIDAGSGVRTDEILQNAERDGVDVARIKHVVLTHGHADHAAGAADTRRKLDEPLVYASSAIASFLEEGDTVSLSVDAAKQAGRYPPDYPFDACAVDVKLDDRDTIQVGDVKLEVITTPGHSDGDVCLLLADESERILFTGDVVFYGGTVLLQNMWDCRVEALIDSLRKLRSVSATAMLPGHFAFTLRDGQRHIERANARLDDLRLPDFAPVPS